MIMESKNDSYQQYLAANPEIKEDYCNWLGEKK